MVCLTKLKGISLIRVTSYTGKLWGGGTFHTFPPRRQMQTVPKESMAVSRCGADVFYRYAGSRPHGPDPRRLKALYLTMGNAIAAPPSSPLTAHSKSFCAELSLAPRQWPTIWTCWSNTIACSFRRIHQQRHYAYPPLDPPDPHAATK